MMSLDYKNDPMLDGYVFCKEESKNIVIAFRGTNLNNKKQLYFDMFENSIVHNTQYFVGYDTKNPDNFIKPQMDISMDFYNHVSIFIIKDNYKISLTGHSKGGVLVQKIFQYFYRTKAKDTFIQKIPFEGVTFSAPPCIQENFLNSDEYIKELSNVNIRNYVIKNDMIIWLSGLYAFKKFRSKPKYYVGEVHSFKRKSKKDWTGHQISCNYDFHFKVNQNLI